MATPIPVIDLGPFTIPGYSKLTKEEVINAVAEANSTFGCFYLINHGVDRQLIKDHMANLRVFFAQSDEYKNRFIDPQGNPNRGYFGLEQQNVHYTMGRLGLPGDPVEKYVVCPPNSDITKMDDNVWPDSPPALKDIVSKYFVVLKELSITLMNVFSLALKLPGYENFFYEQLHTGDHRLKNHLYPPHVEKKPGQDDRLAEHTDFGPMAILATDACAGALQVWLESEKKWANVNPIEGAFIVNLGEPMVRWTNGKWVAPLHKVAWPEQAEKVGRMSVVYFPHAAPSIVLETIPGFVPAGEKPKYEPISNRDFLNLKIANSY